MSQVSSLHEVYLLLDTDEAAAALQLRESLDTLNQGEASLHINISQCSIMPRLCGLRAAAQDRGQPGQLARQDQAGQGEERAVPRRDCEHHQQ